jgi:integration host factor subunit beta
MKRSDLIDVLAKQTPHLTASQVEEAVVLFFDEIAEALANNGRIELRGFGSFAVRHRAARQARNPKTGEAVFVKAKATPFFKSGKILRDRLNPPVKKKG